jgi:hypothetical protein
VQRGPVAPGRVQRLAAVVVGLLLVAVLAAFLVPQPAPRATGVQVNGQQPGADGRFSVPRPDGFTVTDEGVPVGPDAVEARALGLPVSVGSAGPGEPGLRLDGASEYLAAGPVRLEVTGEPERTLVLQFESVDLEWPLRAAPALLAAFSVAYAEAFLRRIRARRRARRLEVVGMTGAGAVLGLALVLSAWVHAQRDLPALVAPVVVVACAAAGGVLASLQEAASARRPAAVARPRGGA